MGKFETELEENIDRLKREKYGGEESPVGLQEDIERLKLGEPVEYIIGWTDFLGARIDLSLHPMIPRYETAFWVKQAIEELKQKPGPLYIADTFSGAGNVGVSILKHLPNSKVDFSELEPSLAPQIKKNIEINNIDLLRTRIISASGVEGLSGGYDAIFAVPPYVDKKALPELDSQMIHYEPHLAFFAEDEGRAFHRLLINSAWALLGDGGSLYMEADMGQDVGIRKILEEKIGPKWSKIEFWPDPYSASPNVVLRK